MSICSLLQCTRHHLFLGSMENCILPKCFLRNLYFCFQSSLSPFPLLSPHPSLGLMPPLPPPPPPPPPTTPCTFHQDHLHCSQCVPPCFCGLLHLHLHLNEKFDAIIASPVCYASRPQISCSGRQMIHSGMWTMLSPTPEPTVVCICPGPAKV